MQLREIHFNHDPDAGGAIPLSHAPGFGREGQPSAITAPEWRDGVSEPVAYARGDVQGPITIKARFTNGPPGERIAIRAVGPVDPQGGPDRPDRRTTPLGDVIPRVVTFDNRGESGLHEFDLSGEIDRAPVGCLKVDWDWQAQVTGETWRTFERTYHYVYVTLHAPTKWWLKSTVEASVGPWIEAIHLATHWAAGANSVDDCILKVATAINQHPKLFYDESGKLFVDRDTNTFLLSNLLKAFDDAASTKIDCRGLANALVTFANLIGADLRVLHIENGFGVGKFSTHPIRALSAPNWATETWSWHELAVDSASPVCDSTGALIPGATIVDGQTLVGVQGQALRVYDASLHLKEDPPPVFPVGIRLGMAGGTGQEYRDLLVSSGTAEHAKRLARLHTI